MKNTNSEKTNAQDNRDREDNATIKTDADEVSGSSNGSVAVTTNLPRRKRDALKNARCREQAVESFISRLADLEIPESRYLLRSYKNEEMLPIEVYERGARLLERLVTSLAGHHEAS
jgi:hypothetical protein